MIQIARYKAKIATLNESFSAVVLKYDQRILIDIQFTIVFSNDSTIETETSSVFSTEPSRIRSLLPRHRAVSVHQAFTCYLSCLRSGQKPRQVSCIFTLA